MLETLTDRLQLVVKTIRGQARFTEKNISDAMREVRIALIEADVALPVIKYFIDRVKSKALGAEVLKSINPGQAVIKIVQDELTELSHEILKAKQVRVQRILREAEEARLKGRKVQQAGRATRPPAWRPATTPSRSTP